MNKSQLLSTVAASLLLSFGVASAQSPSTQAPARAPAAQQGAPAEKVAPPMHAGERKGAETTGQATHEKPGAATTGQSPSEMKDGEQRKGQSSTQMKPGERGMSGQAQKEPGGANAPSNRMNNSANDNSRRERNENKAEGAGPAGSKMNNQSTGERMNNQSTTEKSRSTTSGQGSAAGAAKLSTEQRTRITTVIKKQNVQSTHLNVSVNVGTRIPESVRFYPLPTEVVSIYPEWRGYDYILVDERVVIIDPNSHEIVFIIES